MVLLPARRTWELLAGTTASFGSAGRTSVVVSARSNLCPPDWIGIVALGDGALVTTPSEPEQQRFLAATGEMPPGKLVQPDVVRDLLPVTDVLGPASLAYASQDEFRPVGSRVDGITSPAFVIHRDGDVVAVSGYKIWMGVTAHICVLTDPRYRNCGLARAVASAAVEDALAAGLLAQWRARPAASRRVAQVLGFTELGSQLSVRTQPTGS